MVVVWSVRVTVLTRASRRGKAAKPVGAADSTLTQISSAICRPTVPSNDVFVGRVTNNLLRREPFRIDPDHMRRHVVAFPLAHARED